MLSMTERDMLRFESIFDLLIRLGFQEDQKNERMVAPDGEQSVPFAQIGGRTVAEFVRWGLQNSLLIPCQRERHQLRLIEGRFLKKPQLNCESPCVQQDRASLLTPQREPR
jgi:hypothetical protein